MAVAAPKVVFDLLTLEDYQAEGVVAARYDIVDGERFFMASPNLTHQRVCGNIYLLLRQFQRDTRQGQAVIAPLDILISRMPLRTRQPDLFFLSQRRAETAGDALNTLPMPIAPELVVEVLSGSDTLATRQGKINDFCQIGVAECWLVNLERATVEVLRLSADGPERVALYGAGETLQSVAFPDLTVALDDFFRIEP